jgi:hypothetical protein
MEQLLKFEEIHGKKYDLSVRWPSTLETGSIFLRNFETFTCYVWSGNEWSESTNSRFLEIGGSTGEIYDNFTLEEARAVRPEAFL